MGERAAGGGRGARRVLILSWRDLGNPLGGGAERYLHRLATGLAARGDVVNVRTAGYPGAAARELVDGVRYLRCGNADTVFPTTLRDLATGRLGRPDVVVDCQNGIPFFSRAVTRSPVVVLVHHVHREQWRVAVGPVAARVGWWLESRVAPPFYRGCRYVAVSPTTRRELVELGVPADRITIVHNGVDEPPPQRAGRSDTPSLVVLSRLVPHKQVEHALEVLARLVPTWPGLTLTVVGDGYWAGRVRTRADELKVADRVRLVGQVDDATKHRVLASAWVHLSASIKEGWGLAIMEAARHGVPTVAYATAGGTADSVLADRTGLLVHDLDGMTRATAGLLSDPVRRRQLGDAARERAAAFTWNGTVTAFSDLVDEVLGRRPFAPEPPQEPEPWLPGNAARAAAAR